MISVRVFHHVVICKAHRSLGMGYKPEMEHLHFDPQHQSAGKLTWLPIGCLMYNKTLGPLWHWLLLVSIQTEQASPLSQRTIHAFSALSTLTRNLHNIYDCGLLILILSISYAIYTFLLLFYYYDQKTRMLTSMLTLMLLTLGGSQWNRIGGSATEFSLVFMPFAISLGFSFALLLLRVMGTLGPRYTIVVS